MSTSNGMNLHNALKKIERLERENAKLKGQLADKDKQIKMRDNKINELHSKNNELYDELKATQQATQPCQSEEPKQYRVFAAWDKGDIDINFIDGLFAKACLQKIDDADISSYGTTLSYMFEGTQSARNILTRILTSICQSIYPESNIEVWAKEQQTTSQIQ